jgi:Ca-activated chloride channel family protein
MKTLYSFLLIASLSHALFDYERAILQTQKNNWPAAQELLTQVIVENPERPDALYDMGVASYKNNNFDAALSYFNKAAHHAQANSALQQQADFNAGNTHVQLKKLHEAIDAYDRVLALKPDHTQALHNKEVVKKMLEQQKQEQQQDKDQNKEDQQKDQDNQDKQNEDNNQSSDAKAKEDRDQKQNKDDQNQKDQQGKKNEEKKKDQKNSDQSDADKSNKKKNESGTDQTEKGQSEQQKSQNQGAAQDNADKSPKDGANPQQATQDEGANTQKLSAGLARVLEDREKKDAQLNKKMTKALVANQGGSKNDYNCW